MAVKNHLPPTGLTVSNLTPKNYSGQPPGTTLTDGGSTTWSIKDHSPLIPFKIKSRLIASAQLSANAH